MLPFALSEGSYVLLIIFSVFYGLDWIATVPPTVGISRQVFGVEKSGVVYGWIFASHQMGAAVAAFGGGVIFNLLDSYTWAFLLAGIFCGMASLFVMIIRKPMSQEMSEGSSLKV
ncbi:MFS permease (monocarboxylate) [Bacillus sp. SG-1]|nr:MFS permease (monocarboxylate) [Bacillus sp. SG-1]